MPVSIRSKLFNPSANLKVHPYFKDHFHSGQVLSMQTNNSMSTIEYDGLMVIAQKIRDAGSSIKNLKKVIISLEINKIRL